MPDSTSETQYVSAHSIMPKFDFSIFVKQLWVIFSF